MEFGFNGQRRKRQFNATEYIRYQQRAYSGYRQQAVRRICDVYSLTLKSAR